MVVATAAVVVAGWHAIEVVVAGKLVNCSQCFCVSFPDYSVDCSCYCCQAPVLYCFVS